MILGWLAVAWLVRMALDTEIGWHRAVARWVISICGLVAALYVVGRNVVSRTGDKDRVLKIETDLKSGLVIEKDYEITAAKRMQEHPDFIDFRRTVGDKVLVLYDAESQQRGVVDEIPKSSSFRPSSRLTMVRAPHTGYVLNKVFSGGPLDAGDPLDLVAPVKSWPWDEEFCDVPWNDLEATYCR